MPTREAAAIDTESREQGAAGLKIDPSTTCLASNVLPDTSAESLAASRREHSKPDAIEVKVERVENSVIFGEELWRQMAQQPVLTASKAATALNATRRDEQQAKTNQDLKSVSAKKKRSVSFDPEIESALQNLQVILPESSLLDLASKLERASQKNSGAEISKAELFGISSLLSQALEGQSAPLELRNGDLAQSDLARRSVVQSGGDVEVAEQVAAYYDEVEGQLAQDQEYGEVLRSLRVALGSDTPEHAVNEILSRYTPQGQHQIRERFEQVFGTEMPDPREVSIDRMILESERMAQSRMTQLRGAERNYNESRENYERAGKVKGGIFGSVSAIYSVVTSLPELVAGVSGDKENRELQMNLDKERVNDLRREHRTISQGVDEAKLAIEQARELEREGRRVLRENQDAAQAQELFNQAQLAYSRSYQSITGTDEKFRQQSAINSRYYRNIANTISDQQSKIDSRYGTAITVLEGAQTGCVIAGATVAFIATAPVSLPLAVVAGMGAGVGIGVLSETTEGIGHVGYGNKDLATAARDAGSDIVDHTKTAAITTAGNLVGVGAANVVGRGLQVGGQALVRAGSGLAQSTKVAPAVARASQVVSSAGNLMTGSSKVAVVAQNSIKGAAAGGAGAATMSVANNSIALATGAPSMADGYRDADGNLGVAGTAKFLVTEAMKDASYGVALGGIGGGAQSLRNMMPGGGAITNRLAHGAGRLAVNVAEGGAVVVGAKVQSELQGTPFTEAAAYNLMYTWMGNAAAGNKGFSKPPARASSVEVVSSNGVTPIAAETPAANAASSSRKPVDMAVMAAEWKAYSNRPLAAGEVPINLKVTPDGGAILSMPQQGGSATQNAASGATGSNGPQISGPQVNSSKTNGMQTTVATADSPISTKPAVTVELKPAATTSQVKATPASETSATVRVLEANRVTAVKAEPVAANAEPSAQPASVADAPRRSSPPRTRQVNKLAALGLAAVGLATPASALGMNQQGPAPVRDTGIMHRAPAADNNLHVRFGGLDAPVQSSVQSSGKAKSNQSQKAPSSGQIAPAARVHTGAVEQVTQKTLATNHTTEHTAAPTNAVVSQNIVQQDTVNQTVHQTVHQNIGVHNADYAKVVQQQLQTEEQQRARVEESRRKTEEEQKRRYSRRLGGDDLLDEDKKKSLEEGGDEYAQDVVLPEGGDYTYTRGRRRHGRVRVVELGGAIGDLDENRAKFSIIKTEAD